MFALAALWRWWAKRGSASGGRRVRWLYVAMTLSFSALALVASLTGDAAVAVLAGLAGVVTVVLAVVAPRFAGSSDRRRDVE